MIYVTSDLHGYPLEKFKKLLEKANFSDNDHLFVLGDVIDRGEEGINLLQWIMKQPNVDVILGNHETFMLCCDFLLQEITEESEIELTYEQMDIYTTWMRNGGGVTVSQLARLPKEERIEIFEYLREMPLYVELRVNEKNFVLVHSGLGNFNPYKPLSEYTLTDLVWTRPGLNVNYYKDKITVFGHTPTLYYESGYKGKAIVTDTWVNIDTGAATGLSPMLFRLDDMQEFYADEQ